MRAMGSASGVRGPKVRTTARDPAAACPLDRVDWHFKADCSNRLWVTDYTYVTIRGRFVYVALVIDILVVWM